MGNDLEGRCACGNLRRYGIHYPGDGACPRRDHDCGNGHGNAALVTGNVFSSVRTMTATIAAELGAVPQGGPQYCALFL